MQEVEDDYYHLVKRRVIKGWMKKKACRHVKCPNGFGFEADYFLRNGLKWIAYKRGEG